MKRLISPSIVSLVTASILTGCNSKPSAQAVAPTPPTTKVSIVTTPATEPPKSTNYPTETEEYYVGMIADSEDPRFAYQPGVYSVETRPSRRRLGGDNAQIVQAVYNGPRASARFANDHPEPTAAELEMISNRAQKVVARLESENDALRAKLAFFENSASATPGAPAVAANAENPAPASPDASDLAPLTSDAPASPIAATPAAPAPEPEPEFNIVRPNSEYVIELDPAYFVSPNPTSTNPFVQLYQPPVTLRDVTLVVSAAVPGPNPTAVLNDVPLSVHDSFQGLEVYRIESDTVYLRKDTFLLACPVSERALKLRLP